MIIDRIVDWEKVLPIIEIYTAIQSEGSRAGKPTIVVRTSGCTHRCYFGSGGWCDSWYTSIHPEKGVFCFQDIVKIYDENPQISEMMLTGGSPSMYPTLVNELLHFAESRDIVVTMETEGSHFLETEVKIDLISLSPKFSNSVPQLGTFTPKGKVVDQKFIDQHNKFRMNYEVMKKMIDYHRDFHIKPVIDRNNPEIWEELEVLLLKLCIPNYKVWCMPAGDTLDKLQPNYAYVMEECIKRGYNFTGRPHIVAYNDKRGV
jgi:7-carboxy-7-deazaguanine synthase